MPAVYSRALAAASDRNTGHGCNVRWTNRNPIVTSAIAVKTFDSRNKRR